MNKFKCEVCGYTYDEAREGKPFADVPNDWTCPTCGVDKTQFKKI